MFFQPKPMVWPGVSILGSAQLRGLSGLSGLRSLAGPFQSHLDLSAAKRHPNLNIVTKELNFVSCYMGRTTRISKVKSEVIRGIVDYCGLLWIIVDYCGLLWIIVDYCGLLWIIVDYCGLLWIIVDYCRYCQCFLNMKSFSLQFQTRIKVVSASCIRDSFLQRMPFRCSQLCLKLCCLNVSDSQVQRQILDAADDSRYSSLHQKVQKPSHMCSRCS